MFKLRLFKEDFKFSAAHFLIFDEKRAERLHGHNYWVRLELHFDRLQSNGLLVDFKPLKKIVREHLSQWDEYVLLPGKNEEVRTKAEGSSIHVEFRDRRYVFPKQEVKILPVVNISVEELSHFLAQEFKKIFSTFKLRELSVEVEESPGQSASCSLKIT